MSARVVLLCDRCEAEAPREQASCWSVSLVSLFSPSAKQLDLCPRCTRELQLWLLGERAPVVVDFSDVGERASGAV